MNLPKPKTYDVWKKYGPDCVFGDIIYGGVDAYISTTATFTFTGVVSDYDLLLADVNWLREEIAQMKNQLITLQHGIR